MGKSLSVVSTGALALVVSFAIPICFALLVSFAECVVSFAWMDVSFGKMGDCARALPIVNRAMEIAEAIRNKEIRKDWFY
jgi:hypothetical protein